MSANVDPIPPTQQTPPAAPGSSTSTPKVGMGFARFLLGMVVVSIPVVYLELSGKTREAWVYTWLIVLVIVLAYSNEFSAFFSQLGSLTRGK